ncbi:MAG: MBOAT family protein [Candidatus Eremiobacteraeota bacterium]|nr:MBOAT family protein [Candidatus Eremiobacteraeota bacterium]
MIFNTWVFGVFAVVTFVLYWTVVPQRWKPAFLIVTGSIFYAYSVPAFLLLVLGLGIVTFFIGNAIAGTSDAKVRKRLLVAGVVSIAAVLVFFKYTKFVATTVDEVARHHILPIPTIVVPLAISFFTFEFVHVLVDVYLRKIERLDPLDFSVFTMFFPTLVAGPIKRYQSFAPQVRRIVLPASGDLALNLYRVILGLAKKTIVADSMNAFTGPLAAPDGAYGRLDYWVAVLAYTTKIYFDFSGYSDIAIGVAGLLGLRIPENFDMPYRTRNISEFWRRWHMSLSAWIRDYIFIPLGGSRGSPLVTVVNLLLAMAIAGLWHGAAWTFVLWGLWQGAGLIAHRTWGLVVVPRVAMLRNESRSIRFVSVATTFAFVAIGWILFAAPSLGNAVVVFERLFV